MLHNLTRPMEQNRISVTFFEKDKYPCNIVANYILNLSVFYLKETINWYSVIAIEGWSKKGKIILTSVTEIKENV